MRGQAWIVPIVALLTPGLALAHPGGAAHDALHGLLHPLTGPDHILAMVSVGLLAAQMGGRALWALPLSFVAMMAAGGALGMAGTPLWGVETVIAISVIVLGAAIATGIRVPTALAATLVGAFAIFHGHAHGAEMPATSSGFLYGLSFMAATALLHGLGIGAYLGLTRAMGSPGAPVIRVAGGVIALAGVALLVGAA